MRSGILGISILVLLLPSAAGAQSAMGEVTAQPICFSVRNTAEYGVMGTFTTELYTAPDGNQGRHRINFRFDAAGSKNEEGKASDRGQYCTTGPFFEGRKLDLTLRTLIPIFTCKTRIDMGEILIQGKMKPGGGTDTTATCFN